MDLRTLARRFLSDERGSIVIVFVLALIPMLGLVGAAIDYSRAAGEREKIQHALDMAVLAVNREIGRMNNKELRAYAQDMLAANLQGLPATIDTLSIDKAKRTVDMTATAGVETSFLKILNIDTLDVVASAQSVTGANSIEVALVLDNSGSMAGSRINTLRDASRDLVRTLFKDKENTSDVSISIVPFAGAVNVGAQNATATWLDRNALSGAHQGLFADPVNRLDLYDEVKNVKWAGCVEVRPAPYHTTDEGPAVAVPDTLFVPSFAPDEPDAVKLYYWSVTPANSYLDDVSGSCAASVGSLDEIANTGQVCKYENVTAKTGKSGATVSGPNYICDSEPITPLTATRSKLLSAIGQMQTQGYTNILEGVMWGWRTLSPGEPFSEGRAYDAKNNSKFMIVMTDGANTVPGNVGKLTSAYTAFGHANLGRLGTGTANSAMVEVMNDYTLEGCANAKRAGIKIFTIAFAIDDEDTVDLLRACASASEYAFDVKTTGELSQTFADIAGTLGQLRIAE